MDIDTLIRFYVNNGTEKTVQAIKNGEIYIGLLQYMITCEDKNVTLLAKNVAKHLLEELDK